MHAPPSASAISDHLRQTIAGFKGMDPQAVDIAAPFASFGIGSLDSVKLAGKLKDWLGREVPVTAFWDHPSIEALSTALAIGATVPDRTEKRGLLPMTPEGETADIAVVGMALRFPGASSPHALWTLMLDGQESIQPVAALRWPVLPDDERTGLIDSLDQFDPAFFGISSPEADEMDPQQRLLLELTWEALEDAGIAPADLQGSRTGVFVGVSSFDYQRTRKTAAKATNVYAAAGGAHSIAANRISYVFNFRGPSLAVDTACSSSLVALHTAVRSLREGECDLAVVGGVNVLLDPALQHAFRGAGMLAPDGRCKAYDDSADGYVRSEGCGIVLLQRGQDGPSHRAPRAWVCGTAVNQDGRSNGLFAPNGGAQVDVIQQALAKAGLSPVDIVYLEGHGTGTRLGDAIELRAVQEALGQGREGRPLHMGAVKANIGHLEAAAGIAGFIKTVLVLEHRQAPPLRMAGEVNSVAAGSEVLTFAKETQDLAMREGALYAGVSSFGFGGTNAHAILKASARPLRKKSSFKEKARLLLLSARDQGGLQRMAGALSARLRGGAVASQDICHTVNAHRELFAHRMPIVADDDAHLVAQLNDLAQGILVSPEPMRDPSRPRRMVWQFSGQGAQYAGMARQWYAFSPVFRRALDAVCAMAQAHLDEPLLPLILEADEEHDARLRRTSIAQPALFCVEWSLAQCMSEWVATRPVLMTGHSLGFYVAACFAGALPLEQAVALVCQRGACMQATAGQAQTLVVFSEVETAMTALSDLRARVDVCVVNAPTQFLLGCPSDVTAACLERLIEQGIEARLFNESHAFHSRWVRDAMPAWQAALEAVAFLPTQTDLVCDRTGMVFPAGTVFDAAHWLTHTCESVRFDKVHEALKVMDIDVLLELGPGSSLTALAVNNGIPAQRAIHVLARRKPAWPALLSAIAALFKNGVRIDGAVFGSQFGWRQVDLPSYPWQRQRCWVEGVFEQGPVASGTSPHSQNQIMIREKTMSVASGVGVYADALAGELARTLRLPMQNIDRDANLLDLGVDSLTLMGSAEFIETRFGVRIPVSDFFTRLNTISLIAAHLHACGASDTSQVAATSPVEQVEALPMDLQRTVQAISSMSDMPSLTQPDADTSSWAHVFEAQLDAVSRVIQQQLQTLGASGAAAISTRPSAKAALASASVSAARQLSALAPALPAGAMGSHTAEPIAPAPEPPAPSFMPFKVGQERSKAHRSERQAAFLARFMEGYNGKTGRSKAYADQHRTHLADNRMVSGFRLGTKSLVYPIVSSKAQGSRIWDIDGNSYLDLTMGFGVALFGHNPPFLAEPIAQGVKDGFSLGPQSDLAGEVAQLLCEITEHERATFANTGSEAVMLALRLARAETGRPLVVIFAGSYHGTADTVMARAGMDSALPFAPGITSSQVQDLVILTYGDTKSLEYIRKHASTIAAVLVEPVQSRSPEVQPREFLVALRQLTSETGVALVFDEVLNGFRIHLRGGQGYYGIQADLAAYGKIMGGGLPVGAVAGQARYLDHIDGGQWRYGDDSYPAVTMTFFAGTFCKHPLALRAAKAALQRLKDEGHAIIEATNQRTSDFVAKLNAACAKHGVDLRVERCGSLFRFPQVKDVELLHYALIARGLYIWEGRNCFISEAHTVAELDAAAKIFDDVLGDLARHGFLGATVSTELDDDGGLPAVTNTYALSQEQEQLLALFHMGDPRWVAYNVCVAVRSPRSFEASALTQAVQLVLHRHEALRSKVAARPGATVLDVAGQAAAVVHVEDLPVGLGIDSALRQASHHRFDPYEECPLRVHMWRTGQDGCVLMLVMHHLLVDGWSAGIVLDEVLRSLDGAQRGLPPPYPFSRFLEQRGAARDGQAYAALRTQVQQDIGTVLNCPPAFPLPENASTGDMPARQLVHRLSESATQALRQGAKALHMTLYQVMLGAYALAMHRVSGASSVKIAMALGGRDGVQGEALVGYCSNLCLMVSTQSSATEVEPWSWFADTRNTLLAAMSRGAFSYADLVHEAHQTRQHGAAMPDLVFNLERHPDLPAYDGEPLRWVPVAPADVAFAQFVNVVDEGDALTMTIDHRPDVPAAELMRVCLSILANLTAGDPDDGGQAVPGKVWADVGLPSAQACAESAQLIAQGRLNALDAVGAGWLADFIGVALRRPKALALQGPRDVSYGVLLAQALGVAAELMRNGVQPGCPVGVCMPPGTELVAALLGVALAGGHYVPLDPAYPPQRIADCVADATVDMVLTHADAQKALPMGCRQLDVTCVAPCADVRAALLTLPDIASGAIAYLIHTSGSTGKPKGVPIEHASLTGFLRDLRQRWRIGPQDAFVNLTSMSFDIAGLELYLALISGARCVVASSSQRVDGAQLAELIDRTGVTVVQATPSTWELLLGERRLLPSVRLAGVGGEAAPRSMFDRIMALGIEVWNLYGPTEATIWASVWRADRSGEVMLGEPLDGVELIVLKEDGSVAKAGESGELMIGGRCLARGYQGRPGLTAERFQPHPLSSNGARLYRTGDLVKMRAEGGLVFLNRADAQIKLRGYRIELGEIEQCAQRHPAIRRAICLLDTARDGIEAGLTLYVQCSAGSSLTEREVRQYLGQHLPPYMLPARIEFRADFPLTLNGKVDRKALGPLPSESPAKAQAGEQASAIEHDASSLTAAMLIIWREVLEDDHVQIDTDFFDAGGYSLKAVRIVMLCKQRLNVQIRYEDLVSLRTVAALVLGLAPAAAPVSVPTVAGSEPVAPQLPQLVASAPTRKVDNSPKTPKWRHRAFLAATAALHVPATLMVWHYMLAAAWRPSTQQRLRQRYPRLMAQAMLRAAGAHVEMSGSEYLPSAGRPILLVSNHNSLFDAYLLLAHMPFAFKSFSSDADHVRREGLNFFAWVERNLDLSFMHYKQDPLRTEAELDKALAHLRANGVLAMFPQGQISGDRVSSIGDACGRLALEAGALVVPVALPDSSKLFEDNGFRFGPAHVRVRIGPLLDASKFDGNPQQLTEHIRLSLQSLLDEREPLQQAEAGLPQAA